MTENRTEIIEDIVRMEWNMFQQVQNEGGRASCQDDPETFRIMRTSQFDTFPDTILIGYHRALIRAQMEDRNLIMEKYARMMASTAPDRYRQIEHLLPVITERHRSLVENAIAIHKIWMAEHAAAYPALSARGRYLYTEQDTPWETSSETYLRGELLTWPESLMEEYLDHLKQCRQGGRNLVIEQDLAMVRQYGYHTLEEAEKGQRSL